MVFGWVKQFFFTSFNLEWHRSKRTLSCSCNFISHTASVKLCGLAFSGLSKFNSIFWYFLVRSRIWRAPLPLPFTSDPRQVRLQLSRPRPLHVQVGRRREERGQVSRHQGEGLGLHELQTENYQALKFLCTPCTEKGEQVSTSWGSLHLNNTTSSTPEIPRGGMWKHSPSYKKFILIY